MKQIKAQRNKLNRSIVFSLILHILLFSFIIFSDILSEYNKLNDGNTQYGELVNNSIIVNPDATEQFNKLQLHQASIKLADIKQKGCLQQQEEIQKQQKETQTSLEIIKKEGVDQQHKQAEEVTQVAKKVEVQQKNVKGMVVAINSKAKQQERIIKNQSEAKVKIETQTKKKSEKNHKEIATKKKVDAAKQQIAVVEELLSKLIMQQPTQQISTSLAEQNENRKSKVLYSSDISDYANKVKTTIQNNFFNTDVYHGKNL